MGLADSTRAILTCCSNQQFRAVGAAICCMLALASCGSTRPNSTQISTNATNAALLVKYSACMRSHGVPDFPDPSTSQRADNSFGVDGYNFNLPANLNAQAPAYQSAERHCQGLIGLGGSGPARNLALVAKAKQAALAHAQCMREHGVPSFPDPTVKSVGGAIVQASGGGGINPRSPAFQQAQKICQPR